MRVIVTPVTPFQQNCSLVWCAATRRAAIIDPGGDTERVLAHVAAEGLVVEKLLLTHGHLDHAAAAGTLARELRVPIEGPHREDRFWLDALPAQAARYGFPPAEGFLPDRWLDDGDTITVGDERLEVLHCPGHTPGHVIFFHRALRLAFVGDVLFSGSVGRTDFPRGDAAQLVRSITGRLWPLGDDVTFIPGHGPTSTFGEERRTNPYVGDRALART